MDDKSAHDPDAGTESGQETSGGPAPTGRVRYSRRRFLYLLGGLAAGFAGVAGVFRWLSRGGGAGLPGLGGGVREMGGSFPVLSVEDAPDIPAAQWIVTVDGLVEEPLQLDQAAWAALPHVDETADFNCVEGWSVDNVHWGGVAPRALLDQARVKPDGKFITFHAEGGTYVDDLSLDQALDPQTLLADALGGAPLPREHGGPVRLVIPTQLGYKSVKWVTRLEVTDKPVDGYWEQRGYPRDAPV